MEQFRASDNDIYLLFFYFVTLIYLSLLAIGDAAMDPIDFPIAPTDAMIKVLCLPRFVKAMMFYTVRFVIIARDSIELLCP